MGRLQLGVQSWFQEVLIPQALLSFLGHLPVLEDSTKVEVDRALPQLQRRRLRVNPGLVGIEGWEFSLLNIFISFKYETCL